MTDFLRRAAIPNFDAAAYMTRVGSNTTLLPNVAIAFSGGGYRALMNGGGFFAAADSRTSTTSIAGLVQSATYIAGLSGGGWLVGSIYTNNFSSVVQLRDSDDVWRFDRSIIQGPERSSGISALSTVSYWTSIAGQVDRKSNAAFNTSLTDYWGRALSYQLVKAADGGPAYTYSSIAESPEFTRGDMPMPIIVADGRAPGTKIISLNSTVFEFNPYEMGSWDPNLFGFAPTKYVGSNFNAGTIAQNGQCVAGFDQVGFVMGTSSSLFNTFLLQNLTEIQGVPDFVVRAATGIATSIGAENNDIAQWQPNPFRGFNPAVNPTASSQELSLVDGGLDLQNLPLHPLIQPVRAVDVIFAVDSSADTPQNWPNGTALRASYDRSKSQMANGTLFPPVPDANTFVNLGLNRRPVFFGCDAANFTLGPGQRVPPLVVYVPNAPYTAQSNVSTFQPSYTLAQRNDIIRNGFDSATQGNGTVDAAWPSCVACAVLSRSFARSGTPVPAACTSCFTRYCWNGTVDNVDRGAGNSPPFIIADQSTSKNGAVGAGPARGVIWSVVGVVVAAVLVL